MAAPIPETCKQGIEMKNPLYTEIICKGYCRYYSPGKEEFMCGSYEVLRLNLTPQELRNLVKIRFRVLAENLSDYLRNLFCNKCKFKRNDCDFYAGLSDTPCGGYMILKKILSKE